MELAGIAVAYGLSAGQRARLPLAYPEISRRQTPGCQRALPEQVVGNWRPGAFIIRRFEVPYSTRGLAAYGLTFGAADLKEG